METNTGNAMVTNWTLSSPLADQRIPPPQKKCIKTMEANVGKTVLVN